MRTNFVDRLFLILVLLLWLLLPLARAATLSQTNSLALEWTYPTAAISPDLGFVLYSSTNLAVPMTNWPVLTVVSISNQVSFGGQIFPLTNVATTTFAFPVASSNVVQFFSIAASNAVGTGQQFQANPPPEIMPLESIGSFLLVN